ncbi:MAG: Ig-like domain-containing protein [Gemmatimonadaceae bacterium]
MRTIDRIASLTALAVAVAAMACSEKSPSEPGTPVPIQEPPPGMIVSNALAASTIASIGSGSGSNVAVAGNTAYVSAAPGTFPQAFSVTIRNETRNGSPKTAPVQDGGFDPVGIEADDDDVILLTLSISGGGSTSLNVKVPRRQPPAVVRTNPSKGRTDVALSVIVTIIFSEPVDKSTVTPSTVGLLLNGNAVAGSVQVAEDGLSAEFTPAGKLEPQQTYSIVVDQGVRDLEGDALAAPVTVTFTTTPVGSMTITTVTNAASSEYLDSDGYVVSVTGQPDRTIGVNGSVTIESLALGVYEVTLKGMSQICALDDPASVTVWVLAGLAPALTFHVTCRPPPDLQGMLVFVSERDGNSEIYSSTANGTGLVRLTDNPANDFDPAWSPDGTRILFASSRDAGSNFGSDIYVMDAAGSNVVRLTTGGGAVAPAWSPDGRKIAYSGALNGQTGIFVASLDDLSAATNIAHAIGYQTDPAWSPDGKKISFTADWRAYDFLFDLYIANVDGSGIQPLIYGPFFWNDGLRFYFQSAWSPDGQKIAVVVCPYAWDNCYPNSSIGIANADGTNLTTLVQAAGYARPAWSPDGKFIAYSTRFCRTCTGTLRFISVDGTSSGLILSDGHSPSWKPDVGEEP